MYHKSGSNFKTNSNVQIAEKFFGYIYGIQYFKVLSASKGPDLMQENSNSNSSLLFFYKVGENLENLAVNDRVMHEPLVLTTTPTYDRIPFETPLNDVQWDGVTCNDQSRILHLDENSKLETTITRQA